MEVIENKRLQNYFDNKATKEFLSSLAKEENCEVSDLLQSKRGKYGGTWAHPLIFLDLCMWLSPKFKVAALKIVYDHFQSSSFLYTKTET